MSCEEEKLSDQPERPPVDVHRATRRFERLFGGRDVFGLRDYRTSWERAISPHPEHSIDSDGWITIAEIIFTKDDQGHIIGMRIERVAPN